MQRVGCHHAVLEGQKLDERKGRGRFAAFLRQNIGKGHAGLCAPCRHHQRRHVALAAFVGASQGLAVDGDHAFGTLKFQLREECFHEALKGLLEGLGIEHAEDTAERVVARRSEFELQDRPQQLFLGAREQGHVAATRPAAQCRQKRDEQDLRKIVQSIRSARLRQIRKAFRKPLHRHLLANHKKTSSESVCSALATPYRPEHAIPLHSGVASIVM
jgi:hypothetical protein